MTLLAVTDATVLEIAKMLFTLLGTLFSGIMAYYMALINAKAHAAQDVLKDGMATAAAQREETKTTLAVQTQVVADKLDDIRAATDTTNALVASK